MELEFLASSNPPSADEDENGDNVASDDDGAAANCTAIQEDLEARICIPLQTPVIRGGPRLRRSRTPVSIHSIRRSGMLAAKPRAANSTKQAQSVLLKKLGVRVDEDAGDSEIQRNFKETFRGPMSSGKQQAFQLLFTGDFDPVAMELNMAGLDVVEA